jgi:hypothetical protein
MRILEGIIYLRFFLDCFCFLVSLVPFVFLFLGFLYFVVLLRGGFVFFYLMIVFIGKFKYFLYNKLNVSTKTVKILFLKV